MSLDHTPSDNAIEPVTSFDDPRSRTISEFCGIEHLSLTSYYTLKKHNLGPDELRAPGLKIVRVTAEAHAAWRERMAQLAASKDAALETERRREFARIAGKRAAESADHVSRRRGKRRRGA
jgi:hypothetical protein